MCYSSKKTQIIPIRIVTAGLLNAASVELIRSVLWVCVKLCSVCTMKVDKMKTGSIQTRVLENQR